MKDLIGFPITVLGYAYLFYMNSYAQKQPPHDMEPIWLFIGIGVALGLPTWLMLRDAFE